MLPFIQHSDNDLSNTKTGVMTSCAKPKIEDENIMETYSHSYEICYNDITECVPHRSVLAGFVNIDG